MDNPSTPLILSVRKFSNVSLLAKKIGDLNNILKVKDGSLYFICVGFT